MHIGLCKLFWVQRSHVRISITTLSVLMARVLLTGNNVVNQQRYKFRVTWTKGRTQSWIIATDEIKLNGSPKRVTRRWTWKMDCSKCSCCSYM